MDKFVKKTLTFHPLYRLLETLNATVARGRISLTTHGLYYSVWLGVNAIDVRPLSWQDLAAFYRFRSQVIYLDNASALTRKNSAGLPQILLNLDPAVGSFTGISPAANGLTAWIGQMVYRLGRRSARLSYLLPEDRENLQNLPALLEGLTTQAGAWGAFNLIAEIEEGSPLFEPFRRVGFFVYSRQEVWRIDRPLTTPADAANLWRVAGDEDGQVIRNLYNCLMPPLAQSAEPPAAVPKGLLFAQDGETLAYTEVTSGTRGVYLVPLVHPSVDHVDDLLAGLVQRFNPTPQKPVYVAVRSYQAGLDSSLEEIHAQTAPRQALMVKRLAHLQPAEVRNGRRVLIETRQPEASAPILQNISPVTEPPPVDGRI